MTCMAKTYEWMGSRLLTLLCGALVLSMGTTSSLASNVPDDQGALLEIKGTGVSPHSSISLSSGKGQSVVTQADKYGNFVFSKLRYYSFVPLSLKIALPDQSSETIVVGRSVLDIDLDPYGSLVSFSGKISPAGSVVVNVDGIETGSGIAGQGGEFEIQMTAPLELADGTSNIMASIINLGEACCPSMMIPVTPVQLQISSIGITEPQKQVIPDAKKPIYAPPSQNKAGQKKSNKTGTPPSTQPNSKEPVKKSPAPYMILGTSEISVSVDLPIRSEAVTFPDATYDSTWVGGVKQWSDQTRDAIVDQAMMIGAFIDGRSTNASLSLLGKLNARALNNYQPSDTICKFGTLSRSLASSETLLDVNKKVFGEIIFDRNSQAKNTLYGEASRGMIGNLNDFKTKYCEEVDGGNGLAGYCNSAKSTPDLFFNRDVDFTRVFDVPLTLDVNYSDSTLTDQEEMMIALFQNLSLRDPDYGMESGQSLKKQRKTDDFQDLNQILAVRQLVGNTFANQVAMKSKGNGASSSYMQKVLTKLGLTSAESKKLIGDQPSYYAQMEVLTKKLYQDPAFFANLYDTPENVDRQKVAMMAVSLMQERDLLDSLKRKELLLSGLLELKVSHKGAKLNQDGSVADE